MWKFLILALAAYVLYRLFMNDARKKKQDTKQNKEDLVATGEMVKDPICGAYVASDGGISVRDGEKVHRFCSYECRDTFLKQLQNSGREIPVLTKPEDDE